MTHKPFIHLVDICFSFPLIFKTYQMAAWDASDHFQNDCSSLCFWSPARSYSPAKPYSPLNQPQCMFLKKMWGSIQTMTHWFPWLFHVFFKEQTLLCWIFLYGWSKVNYVRSYITSHKTFWEVVLTYLPFPTKTFQSFFPPEFHDFSWTFSTLKIPFSPKFSHVLKFHDFHI